jgi:hypothetical protein
MHSVSCTMLMSSVHAHSCAQAQTLLATYPIHLALNLGLREEVLITKCLGEDY